MPESTILSCVTMENEKGTAATVAVPDFDGEELRADLSMGRPNEQASGVSISFGNSSNKQSELDLYKSVLGDSGIQFVSKGLSSPHCRLQTLRLSNCHISDEGHVCLALTLMLNPSCVKELDVNHPGESAQKLLYATLKDPSRKVKSLRLAGLNLTSKCCEIVALILQSPNSLKEINLSHNDLRDLGVQLLSKGLQSPHCRLQMLCLCNCGILDEGYVCLALTLMVHPECVKELDILSNHPGKPAFNLLSTVLQDPYREVEALQLDSCKLSDESFKIVALVLEFLNTLTDLSLCRNDVGDSGVRILSEGLFSPNCRLQRLRLACCKLTSKSCETIAAVLQSHNFLTDLNLSHNHLADSGVDILSKGMSSSKCKLQALSLAACKLSEKSCEVMDLVLQSNNCLLELNLSDNELGDSGVQVLAKGISSTNCKLQILRLASCKITEKSSEILASVLQSANSLVELDLSSNSLGDCGVHILSKGLLSPYCKLQTLRLCNCNIQNEGYICLALTLMLAPSCLKELDMRYNQPGEPAHKLLSTTLQDPGCEALHLSSCKLSDKSCEILALILQSSNSLKDLKLSALGDYEVAILSKGLSSPHCKLQTLRLTNCALSDESSEVIACILQSPNILLELDLSESLIDDNGVMLLNKGLSSPHCKLETLRLAGCRVTKTSCGILALLLQSPNSLLHLDLNDNNLRNAGVELLSKGLRSPHCKLQTLWLFNCCISNEGYVCLALTLMMNPSCVKKMDMRLNHPGKLAEKLLFAILLDRDRKPETLKLAGLQLSHKSCETVASVLQSPNSLLELDLSDNNLGDDGIHLLSEGLFSSQCNLQILSLAACKLSEKSCEIMDLVLQSDNCLLELNLSNNELGDSGIQVLAKGISGTLCKLQILRLASCKITEKSSEILASVLQSANSLVELDLSSNSLGDCGVHILSKGLLSPYCKLQTLRLYNCNIQNEGYICLALTLMLAPSCLKELDMRYNHPGVPAHKLLSTTLQDPGYEALHLSSCKLSDKSCEILALILQSSNSLKDLRLSALGDSEVEILSKGLSSPHCKLQTLRLTNCALSDESSEVIACILQSPNILLELDLSESLIDDNGVMLLNKGLSSPHCKLETLRLFNCCISNEGYVCLALTLMMNPSCVKKMDMGLNHPGKLAEKLLFAILLDRDRKPEILKLAGLQLSHKSCETVASVLQSPNSLLELDLSDNNLGDDGIHLLSEGLFSSQCNLQILSLAACKLSEKSCEIMDLVLQSDNCLLELNLSDNELGDSGVQVLAKGISGTHCKLQILRLAGCGVTEDSCSRLASVLQSPNHLTELDLSRNSLGDSGIRLLSMGLSDPHCTLHILRVAGSGITRTSCHILASTLQSSNPLMELDLTDNELDSAGDQLLPKGLSSLHSIMLTLGLEVSPVEVQYQHHGPTNCCKSCEHIDDTLHWILREPSVSMGTGVPVYKHSSPPGSFECTVSGLRWVSGGEVTLQYNFSDPHIFREELAMLQYTPIGPLMDIKVLSGELLEAHLPHFACLDEANASLSEAVRVLHAADSGVNLETCELTRFHAKIVNPSFSLTEVLVKFGIPIKTHLEVLIYRTRLTPLVLLMYVVPRDASMIQAVEEDVRDSQDAKKIKKHRPDMSIWMNTKFGLKASTDNAKISPQEITLKYVRPPDLFEVVIRSVEGCFDLELVSEEQSIWKATFESFEYGERGRVARSPNMPSAASRHSRDVMRMEVSNTSRAGKANEGEGKMAAVSNTDCLSTIRRDVIKRTSGALLKSLLDELQAQYPPVISSREAEEILQRSSVLQDQVTSLIDALLKKGDKACGIMLSLLEEMDSYLYHDLGL
ncbi:hypothetical protein ACEWY4_017337 [Coilia grayii]|uniref:NACHT, LRR and PYD domains-containing protein 12-like n=1 Tax=Coilia grayii TaxID=363190 RepID=A0ABD1JGK5_9TELE